MSDEDDKASGPGFFGRIRAGLGKTRDRLVEGIGNAVLGAKEIDDALLEELETTLITSDLGVEATNDVIGGLTRRVARKELADSDALYAALREELSDPLRPAEKPFEISDDAKPFVILMVGVNGAGKTTTAGKLASSRRLARTIHTHHQDHERFGVL